MSWHYALGRAPRGADLSDCGRYRFLLWRYIHSAAPPLAFVMLNPSTADATKDDATIRACIGIAARKRFGGIIVVNLSPWRATDPRELEAAYRRGEDVLRPDDNRAALERACRRAGAGRIVLAWGGKIRPWMDSAARVACLVAGPGALCLGRTKAGEPRHPLYMPRDTPLVRFSPKP